MISALISISFLLLILGFVLLFLVILGIKLIYLRFFLYVSWDKPVSLRISHLQLLLLCPKLLDYYISIFICLRILLFISSLIYSLNIDCLLTCYLTSTCLCFPLCSRNWFLVSYCFEEKIINIILIFLNLLVFVLWYSTDSTLETVACVLERNMLC